MGGCGGKTVLLLGTTGHDGDDAGLLGRPPTADAGSDSALPPQDTGLPCPGPTELFALGGPCDWSGTCTIDLDPCDAGQGSPSLCECVGNVVTLPPGTGIACTHSTIGSCPAGLVIGGPCDGDTVCTTDYCGPGDTTTCTCEDGVWECPGVTCVPPPPTQTCVNNAPCTESINCQEPDGCETSCTCVQGSFECITGCSIGGSDAGSGPLPQCGPGGGCSQGSCLGPDGCGGEVVCQCSDNTLACPVVTC